MAVFKRFLLVGCLTAATICVNGQAVQTQHLSLPTQTTPAPQQPTQQKPQGTQSSTFSDVQEQAMRTNILRSDAITDIKLPPLDVLIESARNNPRVEFYDYRKIEEQAALKSVKRTWMRYIHLNGTYQYGIMGLSSWIEDPTAPVAYAYTDQKQSWWNFGASISMPLDEIFDRRNRIRGQQARISQSDYELETWYNEQKLVIIEAYTNAEMYLALLPIKSESATLVKQQFSMSQADFINGRIDIGELSRLKGIQNVAITEYEQTRAKLYEAILRLETLTNYKILNK